MMSDRFYQCGWSVTICGCQKLVNIVRIFISSFIVLQEMPFGGGFPEANWTPKRSGVLPDGREWWCRQWCHNINWHVVLCQTSCHGYGQLILRSYLKNIKKFRLMNCATVQFLRYHNLIVLSIVKPLVFRLYKVYNLRFYNWGSHWFCVWLRGCNLLTSRTIG